MEQTILKATARTDNPKRVREAGFTPGVLHGPGTTSTHVQFETSALNKIIANHGSNAKIWVEIDKEKTFGFIKEVQKSPLDRKVIHVSILLVTKDQEVKMQLPIAYHGREELTHRMLQVQVYKSEMDVQGKTALMPDSIAVDVSAKELGDTITSASFTVPKGLKILDSETEIYAVIKAIKEAIVEVVAETEEKPAE